MKTRTILVVDDQPNWRTLLRMLLRTLGMIEEAGSLEEAEVEIKSRKEFSLVITNLQLRAFSNIPDQLGLTVIEKIQQYRPSTPCMILTASDDEDKKQIENYCKSQFKTRVPVFLKNSTDLPARLREAVSIAVSGANSTYLEKSEDEPRI